MVEATLHHACRLVGRATGDWLQGNLAHKKLPPAANPLAAPVHP